MEEFEKAIEETQESFDEINTGNETRNETRNETGNETDYKDEDCQDMRDYYDVGDDFVRAMKINTVE